MMREARQHELPREGRRTRYVDAPRYSSSHRAMSTPRDKNYVALPKGTPDPAIPLRAHTHDYEYSNNAHDSGYHGASVLEHLELDDDWAASTMRVPMSSAMVGNGAVVSRGPNPGNHMLAEFRESFLPMEQRQKTILTEERAVIIEPGAETDLNKYLRHGWRVKSTQPGTDNAFLVIVEREERRIRD